MELVPGEGAPLSEVVFEPPSQGGPEHPCQGHRGAQDSQALEALVALQPGWFRGGHKRAGEGRLWAAWQPQRCAGPAGLQQEAWEPFLACSPRARA